MKAYLYKLTNKVNNTVYIGQARNVKRRWLNHCIGATQYRVRHGIRSKSAISHAILKYGKENFTVETLGFCLSQKAADIAEITLVKYWRSRGKIYNRSDGGNGKRRKGGYTLSAKVRAHIGRGSKEVWARPGHKERRSKSISCGKKGKKFSANHCEAIRKGLTGRHLSIAHKSSISNGVANSWKDPVTRKRRCIGLREALKGNVNVINAAILGWQKRRRHVAR